jgi:actin-like ATPase involved in cell morphogenesis
MLQKNDKVYVKHRIKKRECLHPLRMVVCIPSGITEVEMRAVKESCEE